MDNQTSSKGVESTQVQVTRKSSTILFDVPTAAHGSTLQDIDLASMMSSLQSKFQRSGIPEESLKKLQDDLKTFGALPATWPSKNPQAHLLGLPKELRDMILRHLLVNHTSTPSGLIDEVYNPFRFDGQGRNLQVAILRACRALYEQGCKILYGENTFTHICNRYPTIEKYIDHNAITDPSIPQPSNRFRSVIGLAGISLVRRWKLIFLVESYFLGSNSLSNFGYRMFLDFVRAVQHGQISSVELLPLRGVPDDDFASWEDFSKPLKLLPVACHLSVRKITPVECPSVRRAFGDPDPELDSPLAYNFDDLHSAQLLVLSIRKQPRQQDLQRMYLSLLHYAQSFERYIPFKLGMDLEPFESPNLTYLKSRMNTHPEHQKFPAQNPFSGDYDEEGNWRGHPVEMALRRAKYYCDVFDIANFKRSRAAVIQYLEPQWRRICGTSMELVERIKAIKKDYDGFFNEDSHYDIVEPRTHRTIIRLLSQHLVAFNRDMPVEVQAAVLRLGPLLKSATRIYSFEFDDCSFEALGLSSEGRGLNERQPVGPLFISIYRHAETLYMEILRCRKQLFAHDLDQDLGCEIDVNMVLDEEPTSFDIDEPDFDVKNLEV